MTEAAKIKKEVDALGVVLDSLSSLDQTQREFVLSTAAQRFGVGAITGSGPAPAATRKDAQNHSPSRDASHSAQQFVQQKAPATDVERVTCLAYYLTHYGGKARFKTNDITDANTDAKQPKLANPSAAVSNASSKKYKYLSSVGKGDKQITGFGEQLVNALPDREAVKTLATQQKQRRRKPRAKKPGTSK